MSFWTFSFGHCVVYSSSIYRFWLPLWYLQTLHLFARKPNLEKLYIYSNKLWRPRRLVSTIFMKKWYQFISFHFISNILLSKSKGLYQFIDFDGDTSCSYCRVKKVPQGCALDLHSLSMGCKRLHVGDNFYKTGALGYHLMSQTATCH